MKPRRHAGTGATRIPAMRLPRKSSMTRRADFQRRIGDHQSASPLRPAHLVGREEQDVGAERLRAAVDPMSALNRIAYNDTAAPMHKFRSVPHRLDDARLVVRRLQGERAARLPCLFEQ